VPEVAEVAGVDDVEAAVALHEAAAGSPGLAAPDQELLPGEDLAGGGAGCGG
jgi:hypothetical protein